MPRRERCIVPGVPCHVTQRGVDRRETFSADADRETYLQLIRENTGKYRDSLNCVTYSDGPCSSAASFKMAQIDPHVRSLGAGVSEMLRSSGCPGILQSTLL
jgi:hypothetical protein